MDKEGDVTTMIRGRWEGDSDDDDKVTMIDVKKRGGQRGVRDDYDEGTLHDACINMVMEIARIGRTRRVILMMMMMMMMTTTTTTTTTTTMSTTLTTIMT